MLRVIGVLAAGLSLWSQTPIPQTPPKGAISGIVFDAVSGQPVAGATVTLSRIAAIGAAGPQSAAVPIPRVVTDARGRFVYPALEPAEDYFLGARMPGYEPTRYGWTAPGQTLAIDDIHRVTVAAGQWVADIKIPLWRLPVIGGRVVDERGEPVVGVAVRAFSRAVLAGNPQIVGSNVTTTDDRGVYRLTSLLPGRYFVSVLSVQSTVLATTPEGRVPTVVGELQTGGVGAGGPAAVLVPGIDLDGRHRLALTNFATPPPPSSTQGRAYAAQFYPGVTTLADATAIEVNYRQMQLGIDFQLRPLPAVRVAGRVDGVPSPGMLLRLMPAGNEGLAFGSEAATTILEDDGTFAFFNVPAGRYTLLAQAAVIDFTTGSTSTRLPDAPGFPGGGVSVGSSNGTPGLSHLTRTGARAPSWGRMPVNVGASNIDNLVFPMQPAGQVSGRIAFAPGVVPQPNTRLRVEAKPANGDPSLGITSGAATLVNGVFTFTVEGLLGGTYLLTAAGSFSTMSVTVGGRDVTHTGVDAAASADISDVVITVTDKRPTIRGVVSGSPGRTAGVIVFPVDRALWTNFGWDARHFYTIRAGSTGAFTMRPYVGGDFYIIAVDATNIDAWTDPRFLAAAAPLATRLSLEQGETKTQDLTWRNVVVK